MPVAKFIFSCSLSPFVNIPLPNYTYNSHSQSNLLDNSSKGEKSNMVNPMWSPNPWDKVRPQYRELRALLFSTSMARDSVTGVTRNQTSKPLQTPQIDLRSFKLVSFLNVLWSRTGHSYFQGHISAHTAFFFFLFFSPSVFRAERLEEAPCYNPRLV